MAGSVQWLLSSHWPWAVGSGGHQGRGKNTSTTMLVTIMEDKLSTWHQHPLGKQNSYLHDSCPNARVVVRNCRWEEGDKVQCWSGCQPWEMTFNPSIPTITESRHQLSLLSICPSPRAGISLACHTSTGLHSLFSSHASEENPAVEQVNLCSVKEILASLF